jgi:hypothetical protein
MRVLGLAVVFLLTVLVMLVLFSFPVMWLWNWLMPELFKLPMIDAWQAAGIILLIRLLFVNTTSTLEK